MAIDEIERTAMVQQLINTLGEQPANTLMKCILPDGADQIATKDDIYALKADLIALEERLRSYVDTTIATALAKQTRTLMLTMAGFMLTIWVPLTVGAVT
ncbi:hypothetical protein [Candidatus Poriferisodalis sp.]|uniref:hypothetical protein n=1 Tax=Candidatus Poriferisodalis sp. TaxID=3101277 RepID=UPI003B519CF5